MIIAKFCFQISCGVMGLLIKKRKKKQFKIVAYRKFKEQKADYTYIHLNRCFLLSPIELHVNLGLVPTRDVIRSGVKVIISSVYSLGEMHLAADKQLFCSATGSLIEPTLGLLHVA